MINFIKKRGFIFVMILALLVPSLIVNAATNDNKDIGYEQSQNSEVERDNSKDTSSEAEKRTAAVESHAAAKTSSPSSINAATKGEQNQSAKTSTASSAEKATTTSAEKADKTEATETSSSDVKSSQNTAKAAQGKNDSSSKNCNTNGNANNFLDCLKACQNNGYACNTNIQQCLENWNKTGNCQAICKESNQNNSQCSKPNEETETPAPTSPPAEESSEPESNSSSGSTSTDNQSFEERVAALVNEQRAANGLSPLTLDYSLSNVARAKSQDMHDNNYFSHTSPTYGSPFEMMTAFGISYRTAGENIATGYSTPESVMEGWMNSEGHRANILNGSFTKIGVGYVASGNYWTQEFIG